MTGSTSSFHGKFETNDAVLIQGGHSQPLFMDMLRLSMQRHAAYCNSHKMDYWCHFGNPCPERLDGAWDKVHWINLAMGMHYKYVFWMDTDAAINRFDVDLRDALKDFDIGAVCHDPEKSNYLKVRGIVKHNNVGVTYYRNTDIAREFVKEWHDSYPGEDNWFEQGIFNRMSALDKYKGVVGTVDDTWNATINVNWVDNPNVVGWHGIFPWAKRVGMMKDYLKNDYLAYRI
jgi:hypothetical protein